MLVKLIKKFEELLPFVHLVSPLRGLISGKVWCFIDLSPVTLDEFLGCMFVAKMPGMKPIGLLGIDSF